MNARPVLVFLLTLLVISPIVAIAGVVAWGAWAPTGVLSASLLVAFTGRRALPSIRRSAPTIAGIRLRMLTVVWMVIGAAIVLASGSAVWLGWHLLS